VRVTPARLHFERGYAAREFIPGELWQDLREGCSPASGSRWRCAAWRRPTVRERARVELTKHISLRSVPAQFLRLRRRGARDRDPEWLFDLDYPGH